MGRLIDVDAIGFRCSYGGDCTAYGAKCRECRDYVCDAEDIQSVPTAFDKSAFIAELEKLKTVSCCEGIKCEECKYTEQCFEGERSYMVLLDKVIELAVNWGK